MRTPASPSCSLARTDPIDNLDCPRDRLSMAVVVMTRRPEKICDEAFAMVARAGTIAQFTIGVANHTRVFEKRNAASSFGTADADAV